MPNSKRTLRSLLLLLCILSPKPGVVAGELEKGCLLGRTCEKEQVYYVSDRKGASPAPDHLTWQDELTRMVGGQIEWSILAGQRAPGGVLVEGPTKSQRLLRRERAAEEWLTRQSRREVRAILDPMGDEVWIQAPIVTPGYGQTQKRNPTWPSAYTCVETGTRNIRTSTCRATP